MGGRSPPRNEEETSLAEVLTPGCAVVRISGVSSDTEPWVITMHAVHPSGTSPIPPSDLLALANQVAGGSALATLAAHTTPDVIALQVSARDEGAARAPSYPVAINIPGTGTPPRAPMSTSARTILEIAATAAQPRPGALFWPGVLDSSIDVDALVPAAAVVYNNAATQLQNDIIGAAITGGGVWTPVVRSTRHGGANRPVGVTTPIVAVATRSRLATQVSRLRGRKRRH